MSKWRLPPRIKLYEALGAIGDGRIQIAGNKARVWSSSREKVYDVVFDPETRAIMANDNGSFWRGYLGYPAVCYLLAAELVPYDPNMATYLAGFHWKQINTRFESNYDKALAFVRHEVRRRHPHVDMTWFETQIDGMAEAIKRMDLALLGPKRRPPTGD